MCVCVQWEADNRRRLQCNAWCSADGITDRIRGHCSPIRRPRPRRLATDNAIRWRSAEWTAVRPLARSLARSKSIVSLAPDRCTLVNFRRLQQRRPRHQLRCTVSSRHCQPASVCSSVCLSVCPDLLRLSLGNGTKQKRGYYRALKESHNIIIIIIYYAKRQHINVKKLTHNS